MSVQFGQVYKADDQRYIVISSDIKGAYDKIPRYSVVSLKTGYNTFITAVKDGPEDPPTPAEIALLKKNGILDYGSEYSITSGTDPEFWLEDSSGRMIPAFDVLPAKNPGLSIFYDGFQGEFVTRPAHCLQELLKTIVGSFSYINSQYLEPNKLKMTFKSVHELQPQHFKVDKKHLRLGCSPSLNAYDMTGNLGMDPEFIPLRFAGCHMHFGLSKNYVTGAPLARVPAIVRSLDRIAGVAITALMGHFEDPRRRQFYGLAGEYRLPPYGIEWRVPPASILIHPGTYMLAFEFARMAVRAGLNGLGQYMWDCTDAEAIEVINTGNQQLARDILIRNKEVLAKWLEGRFSDDNGKYTMPVLLKGAESKISDPNDIMGNWRVGTDTHYTDLAYCWSHLARCGKI